MTESLLDPSFRAFFEAAPAPYLVLSPKFTVLAVNEAYLRTVMVRREDILGKDLL